MHKKKRIREDCSDVSKVGESCPQHLKFKPPPSIDYFRTGNRLIVSQFIHNGRGFLVI